MAQISGDLQAETRVRPVNSMQLGRKKTLLDNPDTFFEVVVDLY